MTIAIWLSVGQFCAGILDNVAIYDIESKHKQDNHKSGGIVKNTERIRISFLTCTSAELRAAERKQARLENAGYVMTYKAP